MTLLKKEYNDVAYISGPLLFVNAASDLAYGAIVEIRDSRGRVRGGQVIEVSEENAIIQVFEDGFHRVGWQWDQRGIVALPL